MDAAVLTVRGELPAGNDRAADVRALHDIYVGATVAVERLPLLTANVDHFERMDDVSVANWTSF
ncbi:hypothetical protein HYG81_18625 [Natrinema zhouii]|uniref:type II toxin-antitoxin system VapC family toxin n=1 Tax=Natrinema zhouii TaxID=1710539 RepID=UPI001CF7CED9|nr:hypothetical protein [Natrinema zhouii]UHQ97952.1 hypothetical protein HYG81_18625 [Natrinema zhouii]